MPAQHICRHPATDLANALLDLEDGGIVIAGVTSNAQLGVITINAASRSWRAIMSRGAIYKENKTAPKREP